MDLHTAAHMATNFTRITPQVGRGLAYESGKRGVNALVTDKKYLGEAEVHERGGSSQNGCKQPFFCLLVRGR